MLSPLRLTLRRGTVYYMQHRGVRSEEPHYLVVLNRDPLAGRVLVMACCSSSLHRARWLCSRHPGTYVEITPQEYGELTTLTCVNGNGVMEVSVAELESSIRRNAVRFHPDMPAYVVDRIADAVRMSPVVANELKAML